MRSMVLAAAAVMTAAGAAAAAGGIERACLRSDRFNGDSALCACIQQAADLTLSGGDQRKVAGFFRNPDAAERARASDTPAAEAFWARYLTFGTTAEALCAPEPAEGEGEG